MRKKKVKVGVLEVEITAARQSFRDEISTLRRGGGITVVMDSNCACGGHQTIAYRTSGWGLPKRNQLMNLSTHSARTAQRRLASAIEQSY